MKKCCLSKAFTIIELMVSIFITITIIASFYKLYNVSVKTERSSSIRVAVNLMGEQMLDTIAESIRLTGLNSVKDDYLADTAGGTAGIIRYAGETKFVFLSPFGSPITKVAAVSGTFPACTFRLFNSAAFNYNVSKLYFHNQDGFFKTSSLGASGLTYSEAGVNLTTSGFDSGSYSGESCQKVFPVGSLVTGEDFIYTLEYVDMGDSGNKLTLHYKKESDTSVASLGTPLVNFSYTPNTNNSYSMPKFVLEYLVETCDALNNCVTVWTTPKGGTHLSDDDIRGIVAVRFGFVLLSRKDRVYKGNVAGESGLPQYCIFSDKNATENYYCYTLPSLNYTASVFRRVIYLSNYRFLKDQTKK